MLSPKVTLWKMWEFTQLVNITCDGSSVLSFNEIFQKYLIKMSSYLYQQCVDPCYGRKQQAPLTAPCHPSTARLERGHCPLWARAPWPPRLTPWTMADYPPLISRKVGLSTHMHRYSSSRGNICITKQCRSKCVWSNICFQGMQVCLGINHAWYL